MLNYIAVAVVAAAGQRARSTSPGRRRRSRPRSATPRCRSSSAATAMSGILSRSCGRRWSSWLLYRTTLGFEIRTVGANPDAARYAGMQPRA